MYAVVHGGTNEELRRESAEYLGSLPFDGCIVLPRLAYYYQYQSPLLRLIPIPITTTNTNANTNTNASPDTEIDRYAIGGSLGKDRAEMVSMLTFLMPQLPADKPNHLLGKLQVTSYKLQVTSYKLQATGYKLQVTSYKLQATRYKLQVAHNRLHASQAT